MINTDNTNYAQISGEELIECIKKYNLNIKIHSNQNITKGIALLMLPDKLYLSYDDHPNFAGNTLYLNQFLKELSIYWITNLPKPEEEPTTKPEFKNWFGKFLKFSFPETIIQIPEINSI